MAIRETAILLGLSMLLSGCISFGPEPPDQLLSLTPRSTAPAGEIAGGTVGAAIVVLDPDTNRRLDVTRVPVQINGSSLAYLAGANWVERPARLFRGLLAETLRARSKRLVIEGSDYDTAANATLSGRLLDMGYDAREQAVIVRYDAVLSDAEGKVRSRRFEAKVPGVSADAIAVGPALNEAANDVATQVADWVAG